MTSSRRDTPRIISRRAVKSETGDLGFIAKSRMPRRCHIEFHKIENDSGMRVRAPAD